MRRALAADITSSLRQVVSHQRWGVWGQSRHALV